MNAVILAGGFGSRLSPLTDTVPKPMLSIANTPMLDYTVSHLWDIGVKNYIFTLNYKPESIVEWCIGYHGAVCRFSLESIPLGTAGGVKAVEKFLEDVFFVFSGDIIENIPLGTMLNKHFTSNALVTMAVSEVDDASQFGVCEMDGWGKVIGFKEKPPGIGRGLVNTGVYIINKKVISALPSGIKLDFAKDVFPVLVKRGALSAYIHDGYWRDAGSLQSYFDANFDLFRGEFFAPAPNRFREKILSYTTHTPNPNLVSSFAAVEGAAANCIVGKNARIHSAAHLENCIVLEGTHVTGTHHSSILGANFALAMDRPWLVNEDGAGVGLINE